MEPDELIIGAKTPHGQDLVGSLKRLPDGTIPYVVLALARDLVTDEFVQVVRDLIGGASAIIQPVNAQEAERNKTTTATAALTGKRHSAKMSLSPELLGQVRERFSDVEPAFRAANGYGFDALTESEARYLAAHRSPESVRSRILAQRDAAQQRLDARGTQEGLNRPLSRALPAPASAGMAKDETSRDEVTQIGTGDVVKTIATGNEIRRREIAGSVRAVIGLGDQEAILVRNSGSNSWLMSSWGCPPVQTCRPMTAA